MLGALAREKGVSLENPDFDFAAYKQIQYDKLADEVRSSLNMERIDRILEEGI